MTNEELAALIERRFDDMDLRMEDKFADLRRVLDARFTVINAVLTSLNNYILDLRADISRLRERVDAHAKALEARS